MIKKEYVPSKKILDKYADVLINFALNAGKGVKKGEVVLINLPESARPFYESLYQTILLAKAHPIIRIAPEGNAKFFYENATKEQLGYFPDNYYKALLKEADHQIYIIADSNPTELKDINPKKIFERRKATKKVNAYHKKLTSSNELFYTMCLFGTPAMAKEANLSLRSYWNQIIKACYLDEENPVAKWKQFKKQIEKTKKKLDDLKIKSLHVKSKNTDLTIGLGKHRKWLGMSCHNIPSFEIFISPDWRETRGHIQFTKSLYRYGKLIDGVRVEFNDAGTVKKATAKVGEDVLLEMLKQKNANKLGEFSLTDKRFSRITKFMADTLYDENVGGKFGNTHVAFGNAYRRSYAKDSSKLKKKDWDNLGFNESGVHTDIISTEDRIVTATLSSGKKKVIYKNGMFTL